MRAETKHTRVNSDAVYTCDTEITEVKKEKPEH